MGKAWGAAASVVLGAVVTYLTNLVTSGAALPVACSLAVTVLLLALLAFALNRDPPVSPDHTSAPASTRGRNSPIIQIHGHRNTVTTGMPVAPEADAREAPGAGSARS